MRTQVVTNPYKVVPEY